MMRWFSRLFVRWRAWIKPIPPVLHQVEGEGGIIQLNQGSTARLLLAAGEEMKGAEK